MHLAGCRLTKITISDNVTILGNEAFSKSYIKEIIIGKNVTSYGYSCFLLCSKLETITHRNNIHEGGVFDGCSMWTEIKVNPENTAFKVEDNILYSYDGTKLIRVPMGKEVDEFVVADSVDTLESQAFRNCHKIKHVIINDNVTTIKRLAFWVCGIEQITIGKNVSTITDEVFWCSSLKTVIINSEAVASGITAQKSQGRLVEYAETIYIKEGITPGSYITDTTVFKEEESNKEGYVKYVKIN